MYETPEPDRRVHIINNEMSGEKKKRRKTENNMSNGITVNSNNKDRNDIKWYWIHYEGSFKNEHHLPSPVVPQFWFTYSHQHTHTQKKTMWKWLGGENNLKRKLHGNWNWNLNGNRNLDKSTKWCNFVIVNIL